jgi:hypothetical protein
MMFLFFFRIKPMTRIVSALNIKMFVGRLTAVDVSEEFFGLHYV